MSEDPFPATLCKEGCRPVFRGNLDECPSCGSTSVRRTEIVDADDDEGRL